MNTLPVILPTALMPSLDVQTLAVLLYNQVIYGLPIGPTSIPPPFAALALIALLAKLIVKSFVLTTLELMVVVVPLTCKLPLITTKPVFPTVAGSIVSVAPKLLIKSPAIVMLPALTLPLVTLPVVDTGLEPNAAKLATTLALPYVAASPVSCDPLPMK